MAKESLLDISVSNTKPGDKDKRLNDGGGLYLLIKPMARSGGGLITASKASAKPYHWAYIQSPA